MLSGFIPGTMEKMKTLDVKLVHPGHGQPFTMDLLLKGISAAA